MNARTSLRAAYPAGFASALGAADAYVETGDREPANGLYEAMGFTEAYTGHYWERSWPD